MIWGVSPLGPLPAGHRGAMCYLVLLGMEMDYETLVVAIRGSKFTIFIDFNYTAMEGQTLNDF